MFVLMIMIAAFSFACGWVLSHKRTMGIYRQCVWSQSIAVPHISVARETMVER